MGDSENNHWSKKANMTMNIIKVHDEYWDTEERPGNLVSIEQATWIC